MSRSSVLLVGLFFITTISLFGQKNQDKLDIQVTFDKYFYAKNSGHMDDYVEFMHPQIFNNVPKDSFIYMLQQLQSDTSVKLDIESLESISKIYKRNKIKYALVSYSQRLTFDFYDIKEEGGASYVIQLMLIQLVEDHGKDNVIFDEEIYQIIINMENQMYLVLDPKYNGWKFLSKDAYMSPYFELIIPKEIRKKI
ncbi:MAG: hypothetical protein IIA45_05050 [Bacteroidetes bacterium]|nr:hypothetical protein [Bacteroidota bacterium]